MASVHPIRTLLRPHRPHRMVIRAFSTTSARTISLFDLQARSVSRENQHFSRRVANGNYVDHSPALQLLRSERDLAEGKTQADAEGILLTKRTKTDVDVQSLEQCKAQNVALRAQMAGKEQMWREHTQMERKEWADLEEKSLRLRLMLFISLAVIGLLAADSIALADDVEEHCPGCFSGNTKNQLFVAGYLKQATEASKKWWNKDETGDAVKAVTHKKHEQQVSTPVLNTTERTGQEALPAGWELAQTPDGRPCYINHTDKYTTWVDPRSTSPSMSVFRETATTITHSTSDTVSFLQRLMWAKS